MIVLKFNFEQFTFIRFLRNFIPHIKSRSPYFRDEVRFFWAQENGYGNSRWVNNFELTILYKTVYSPLYFMILFLKLAQCYSFIYLLVTYGVTPPRIRKIDGVTSPRKTVFDNSIVLLLCIISIFLLIVT